MCEQAYRLICWPYVWWCMHVIYLSAVVPQGTASVFVPPGVTCEMCNWMYESFCAVTQREHIIEWAPAQCEFNNLRNRFWVAQREKLLSIHVKYRTVSLVCTFYCAYLLKMFWTSKEAEYSCLIFIEEAIIEQ